MMLPRFVKPIFYFLMIILVSEYTYASSCLDFDQHQCCLKCKGGFFLDECKCYDKDEYSEFFVKMNHYVYILLFVVIPCTILSVGYVFLRYSQLNSLLETSKKYRFGPNVIFEDTEQETQSSNVQGFERSEQKKDNQEVELSENNLDEPLNL